MPLCIDTFKSQSKQTGPSHLYDIIILKLYEFDINVVYEVWNLFIQLVTNFIWFNILTMPWPLMNTYVNMAS